MREIKFRAWLLEEKQMIYQCYDSRENPKKLYYISSIEPYEKVINTGGYKTEFNYQGHENPNCVLMQYTALKDKNGVEIYEGDIVKIGDEKYNFNGVISFENSGWHISTHLDPFTLYGVTSYLIVVGNKYQNPDLLNEIKHD